MNVVCLSGGTELELVTFDFRLSRLRHKTQLHFLLASGMPSKLRLLSFKLLSRLNKQKFFLLSLSTNTSSSPGSEVRALDSSLTSDSSTYSCGMLCISIWCCSSVCPLLEMVVRFWFSSVDIKVVEVLVFRDL